MKIFKDLEETTIKAIAVTAILLCLLCLGAMSCKSLPQTQTNSKIEKDSIHTSVSFIKRDTTIVIPGDTLELKVPVYNLSEVPTTIKTSNGMTLSLSKINDEILAKCNTDDLKKIIELQDQIIKEYKSNSKIETQKTEVPVKYTPKFIQIMAVIGMICIAVILVFLAFKLGGRLAK